MKLSRQIQRVMRRSSVLVVSFLALSIGMPIAAAFAAPAAPGFIVDTYASVPRTLEAFFCSQW